MSVVLFVAFVVSIFGAGLFHSVLDMVMGAFVKTSAVSDTYSTFFLWFWNTGIFFLIFFGLSMWLFNRLQRKEFYEL